MTSDLEKSLTAAIERRGNDLNEELATALGIEIPDEDQEQENAASSGTSIALNNDAGLASIIGGRLID